MVERGISEVLLWTGLAQDRNALNAASGGLARANRIPHSHTQPQWLIALTHAFAAGLPGRILSS